MNDSQQQQSKMYNLTVTNNVVSATYWRVSKLLANMIFTAIYNIVRMNSLTVIILFILIIIILNYSISKHQNKPAVLIYFSQFLDFPSNYSYIHILENGGKTSKIRVEFC